MATVREFDGANDYVTFSIGTLDAIANGACTIAALIRITANGSFEPLIGFETSDPSQRRALWKNSSNNMMFSSSGLDRDIALTMTVANAWMVVIITKTSGTSTSRGHRLIKATSSWGHADAADTSDNDSSTLSQFKIGKYQTDTDTANMRVAVAGFWESVIGNDAFIEAAGLETNLQNWVDLSPGELLIFNQAAVTTAVEVVVGTSAQTDRTGTAVVNDTDLTFDYNLSSDLNLDVGFHQESKSFFAPTLQNQANQNLSIGLHTQTKSFFAPSVANQNSQDLSVGLHSQIKSFFLPTIQNQSDSELEIGFKSSSFNIFQPFVFNEGGGVFEPVLVGDGSLADQIMAGLVSQGFLTGSLADREYARLLSKLGLSVGVKLSIQDLYEAADEVNRIAGLEELV